MTKAQYIDFHFPKDFCQTMYKEKFFKKKNPSHDEIEARICQFFGFKSIYEYDYIINPVDGMFLKPNIKVDVKTLSLN